MVELWYTLLTISLVLFAVLDGWNIGAGVVHLMVGRSDAERRGVMTALGPLWSWHEVWLIAAGGTMLLAFPGVLATAFSGFYLALWMVLWSLVLRGIAVEVAGHIDDPLWQRAWDVTFAAGSILLAVLFGAAFGNVIRGVPLDASGAFRMPLFTDFGVRGQVGILDWYTVSVAVFTVVILAAHGANYLMTTASATIADRCATIASRLWILAALLFAGVSLETWIVRPEFYTSLARRPIAWLAVAAMAGAVFLIATGLKRAASRRALAGSSTLIAAIIGAAAASIFPVMLPSTIAPEHAMTAFGEATATLGLTIGTFWWPLAFVLSIGYAAAVLRYWTAVPDAGH